MTPAICFLCLACFAVSSLLLSSQKIQTCISRMSEMAAKFSMFFWQSQGVLARPSFKTLVESLYQKYILGYNHLQCPTADLLVV